MTKKEIKKIATKKINEGKTRQEAMMNEYFKPVAVSLLVKSVHFIQR